MSKKETVICPKTTGGKTNKLTGLKTVLYSEADKGTTHFTVALLEGAVYLTYTKKYITVKV